MSFNSKNLKQFSLVKSLPQELINNYQSCINAKFRELVGNTFGNDVSAITNYYPKFRRDNSRVRFTLLFNMRQTNRDLVISILNQIAIASIAFAWAAAKTKEAEEAADKATSEHEVYKQQRIESIKSAIAFLHR